MSRSILTATGIIFVLIVLLVAAYLIYRYVKSGRGQIDPVAGGVAEERLTALRKSYDEACRNSNVPDNAMLVTLACNNYVADGACLKHYCWLKDGVLTLFPTWESVSAQGTGTALAAPPKRWRIQASDIICFAVEQGLPDRFVVLQFKRDSGVITLAFSEDASRVFSLLFPEKDFSRLLEEFYPKSSRNIRDIKESFLSLKELRQDDLITEDEYVAKKKEMLILM